MKTSVSVGASAPATASGTSFPEIELPGSSSRLTPGRLTQLGRLLAEEWNLCNVDEAKIIECGLPAGDRFKIEGRNLNDEVKPGVKLFEGLCRHNVRFIHESSDLDQFERDERAVIGARRSSSGRHLTAWI